MNVVGLEDRDWYREEPSSAWRDRWRSGDCGGGSTGVRTGAWLAIAVSAVVTAVVWKLDVVNLLQPETATRRAPINVVRLSESPALDVVASTPRRWTLKDSRFGTLTVVVPVGSTARRAFTNALAERGFQVVG